MKKAALRLLTFLLIISITIPILSMSISAASTPNYQCLGTYKVISVKTGSGWSSPSILFKSEGGTTKNAGYGIGTPAPKMSLKIYNRSNGTTYYKTVTGNGMYISSRLYLDKNTQYTITVTYAYKSVNYGRITSAGGSRYGYYNGTWQVASTSNINSFSIR